MLAQFLDDRYVAIWQSVLCGLTGGCEGIVEVSVS